jgi:hypothetical protein
VALTVDEELSKLEDDLRRLKVEYEAYFNGGAPRPPRDMVFRVETMIKRYAGDLANLNFTQRFKFNALAQKYTVNNQLWRRKLQEKEEGRGQFTGQKRELAEVTTEGTIRIVCSNPETEPEKVDRLLQAFVEAKRRAGERVDNIDPTKFRKFVREKTDQLKTSLHCQKVQFLVSVEDGKVKFKALKAD